MSNIFAPAPPVVEQVSKQASVTNVSIPDYTVSPSKGLDHVIAFAVGLLAGFAILFIFYQIVVLAIFGGVIFGVVNIFAAAQRAIVKRKKKLRVQFFDMLEAMSVAMRAGNPPLKALESAREDLSLIYSESSDIITEIDLIIGKFNSAVPLSETFADFAQRSELEDINSFASIYATIEGKSSRTDEIVRETQQIIADKMEIEMEVDTMMTAAKNQGNIMLVMPLVILAMIGYMGAGFMDALYTTAVGRVIATVGLIIFIISFILMRKLSNIKL